MRLQLKPMRVSFSTTSRIQCRMALHGQRAAAADRQVRLTAAVQAGRQPPHI
jgi:hypothetical protein